MKTMLRDSSTLLVVVLLAMTVASCGNDALRQCEEELSGVEEKNQELQEALRQSHIESQKVKEALAHAQADNERLREELSRGDAVGRTEPDLSWVRETLWNLFHDEGAALWECGESASQVAWAKAMPSASPEVMVQEINTRFKELNFALESPVLVLERIDGDTAVVTLQRSYVVTEQMGSTGAQCYFAGVTFSLTSFVNIDHVRFDIEEGNHGGPGRYDRADFVHLLPLELGHP
jgi:hypothetical protein